MTRQVVWSEEDYELVRTSIRTVLASVSSSGLAAPINTSSDIATAIEIHAASARDRLRTHAQTINAQEDRINNQSERIKDLMEVNLDLERKVQRNRDERDAAVAATKAVTEATRELIEHNATLTAAVRALEAAADVAQVLDAAQEETP